MINPAYMSAMAALVGTFVGGITSIATSWIGQRHQTREQRLLKEKSELQSLYKQFIQEASKVYIDALEHNATELPKLVDIYSTLNRIRVLSSQKVIDEADKATKNIIGVYAEKNKTFADVDHLIRDQFPDPLHDFSKACHNELRRVSQSL